MRTPRALLAFLLVLLLASPALAQGNSDNANRGGRADAPGGAERAAHARHDADWGNLSEAARTRGLERAEQAKLFARFTYAGGNATGRFVSFGLDAATGALRDYAVRGNNTTTTFFTSVAATPFVGNGSVRVTGSRLFLDGTNATLSAHNNPTGLFRFAGENVTVNFTAPANATITPDNRTATVNVGAQHGHVIPQGGNATLSVSGTTISVTITGRGGVLFAAHPTGPDNAPSAANLHAIRDAAASDRVGGILSVVNADGQAVTDPVDLGVTMRVREVMQGRAHVNVSSDEPRGRAVVILLGQGVVNASDRVNVTFDGRAIPRAASATQALLAAPGSPATYNVTPVAGGLQVIVNVPGFSEHAILIEAERAPVVPPTTPALTTPTPTPGATPTGATPTPTQTGGTPTPTAGGETGGDDTPAPALALVLAALAATAVALRRRKA